MLKREASAAVDDVLTKVPRNELDLSRSDNEVWLVKIPVRERQLAKALFIFPLKLPYSPV